jgi:hypothetical protein
MNKEYRIGQKYHTRLQLNSIGKSFSLFTIHFIQSVKLKASQLDRNTHLLAYNF